MNDSNSELDPCPGCGKYSGEFMDAMVPIVNEETGERYFACGICIIKGVPGKIMEK